MTEKKKSKKQIEEELEIAVAKNEDLAKGYNKLLGQAQGVQELSNKRLMSIRLLETFTNTVLAAGEQLRRDMNELNLVQQQSAEEVVEDEGTE